LELYGASEVCLMGRPNPTEAQRAAINASARKCRKDNPKYAERHRAEMKAYLARRTPEQVAQDKARKRQEHLFYAYGLTEGAFASLLSSQGGGCAICGSRDNLCVDHCHTSGDIRGILCRSCNSVLGLVAEDTKVLKTMIVYLGVSPEGSKKSA